MTTGSLVTIALASVLSLVALDVAAQSVSASGASSGATQIVPIERARLDTDADGIPDRLGDTLTVTGRATVSAGTMHAQRLLVYVQDAAAGILLTAPSIAGSIVRGDSVIATGVLEQDRGRVRLRAIRYEVVEGARRVPPPIELPNDGRALTRLQGRLVTTRGVVEGLGSYRSEAYLLLGGDERPPIIVSTSSDQTLPPDLSRFQVGEQVEVTGIMAPPPQDVPGEDYYQIHPRSPSDVRSATPSTKMLGRAAALSAVLLILSVAWLFVLRREVGARTRELAASERRAREDRERLAVLLDQAPVALWSVDRDLRIVWGDGAGLADMGIVIEDFLGRGIMTVLGDGEAARHALSVYEAALAGKPGHYDIEWSDHVWQVQVRPVVENGVVQGVTGAALDVTRDRELERAIEEQRAYFRSLFDEAPEGIVLVDEEGRVIEANPEFERLFGYSAEEAVGRLINDLVAPEAEREEASSMTLAARGERIETEAVRRHKDGRLIPVSILAKPVQVAGQRRVYGIYRDITHQKSLEARLLHSQRLEAVGQLAGGVAHDFNNILMAILGHARMILEDLPGDDPLRDDLEQIRISGERAAELTRQLLTFSRREQVTRGPIDLNDVVRETRPLVSRLIEENVELDFELEDHLPLVEGDAAQLQQIVMNLAINARDAMPEGGRVLISTHRTPMAGLEDVDDPPTGWVALRVRDEGRGLTDEQRARMFEPFYTTKRRGEGTGLGLSTVYGVVEQMAGTIHVDSALAAGTTVTVLLPALEPEGRGEAATSATPDEGASAGRSGSASPQPVGSASAAPADSASPRRAASGREVDRTRAGHILLVDDDRAVREVTRRLLQRGGYDVVARDSARAALEYCETADNPPALVLSDIVMPGMSGFELAARLRERYPDVRILLMTGYSDWIDREDEQAFEILNKPIEAATLLRRVREAIG